MAKVIDQWQKSPEYRALSASTKSHHDRYFRFLDHYRRHRIRDLKRADMLEIRDQIAINIGPAAANGFIDSISRLMTFALDREHIDSHPLLRVKRLKIGEWKRWPETTVQFALDTLPDVVRRAVVLALYTGQRGGDCIRMLWSDFDGQGIAVVQEKTGEKLWVPCHKILRQELETWPRESVTILTNSLGRPWKADTFRKRMHEEFSSRPELAGYQFHGLRKSAAARLAEAGCSVREIASITGHRTLAMVAHYTAEADQRNMATAAIFKLENVKDVK